MIRPLLLTAALLLAASDALARARGIDSRTTFAPIGCGSPDGGAAGECHTQAADDALLVTIDGPTRIGTGPEDAGFYTVSIPEGFAGLQGAGMNVAIASPNATGCELEPFAPLDEMALRNDTLGDGPLLSHDYRGEPPPSALVGVWSYQFLVLHCAQPGPLLLLAAMNAFDGSGDETGEIWNRTELAVTVPEPSTALLGAGTFLTLATLLTRRTSALQLRRRRQPR